MSILAANVQTISMIVWIVLLVGVMYFLMVRPQQKETKRKNAMMSTMEVGDTVLKGQVIGNVGPKNVYGVKRKSI